MDKILNDFSIGLFFWQFLILLLFSFLIFCIIDISKAKFEGNNKIYWMLLVFLLPFPGVFIYFFIGRKEEFLLNKYFLKIKNE
ncbi:PLD nuclease N-terminal domain-containing protein [Marixanthomonas ophiurae]|uniref:PLDc_N domain-containing protein n=1 Tax=Marixanthomonas ophiurae TaxID=387659 RepID=A0A3E1Q7X7_9FLAO|nr:PLD nuclease N-terminal domain-containing protein [Marixanthomonas ophiurae]RFN58235.1 PLDc_N domain-containing protein [Marixanthomonas ophiurae]